MPPALMRSLHVVVICCAWTGQQRRSLGFVCHSEAYWKSPTVILVVTWPLGQMALVTVKLKPSSRTQVTQNQHRLTLLGKSQHRGQLPVSSVGPSTILHGSSHKDSWCLDKAHRREYVNSLCRFKFKA